MKIATNIPALQAKISISAAGSASKSASGKLSSGLKINVAADDLTGMAISARMKSQIRGSSRASQNTMDGISLVQTADGALQEVHNMLQRIRELTIQSANSTYTQSDLKNITMEIEQMKEEIDAISNKTEFNKIKLFDGTADLNTMGINADVLSVTTTVKPGEYKINLIESGTKSLYVTGSSVNTQVKFPSEQLKGSITINDISVEILETDSMLDTQKKLMSLAKECGLVMTSSDDGASIKTIEAKEAGSKNPITISSNNNLLLDALGMNSNAVYTKGTDATVELIRNSSDESSVISDGATYTIDGNKITIYDIDNQRLVAELKSDFYVSVPAENHVKTLIDEISIKRNALSATYNEMSALHDEISSLSSLEDLNDFADKVLSLEQFAVNTADDIKALMEEAVVLYPELETLESYKKGYESFSFHADHYTASFATSNVDMQNVKDLAAAGDLEGAKQELLEVFDSGLGNKDSGGVLGCARGYAASALKLVQNMDTQIKKISECTINVSENGLILQVGANEGMQLNMSLSKVTAKTLGIDDLEINTLDKAQEAIGKCDFAIGLISDIRAMVGSYQNRLSYTGLNLSSIEFNLSKSLSIIQDADLAKEMAETTRNSVLEQAGMFVLSQANQKPQELLQLLR